MKMTVFMKTQVAWSTLGPTSASTSGTWQPSHQGRAQAACTGNPQEEDGPDEDMGDNDPPLENPPPKGGGGKGALPGGRGEGG